jgi:hypothetical protein
MHPAILGGRLGATEICPFKFTPYSQFNKPNFGFPLPPALPSQTAPESL